MSANILGVSISFFFGRLAAGRGFVKERESLERMARPETIELVRLYYAITDSKVRRSFLDMVKAIAAESAARRVSRSLR